MATAMVMAMARASGGCPLGAIGEPLPISLQLQVKEESEKHQWNCRRVGLASKFESLIW